MDAAFEWGFAAERRDEVEEDEVILFRWPLVGAGVAATFTMLHDSTDGYN